MMDAGNSSKLGFEMFDGPRVWLLVVEISECSLQQLEQFRLTMIALSAQLNQFNKVSGSLSSQVSSADPGKWIAQRYFG